MIWRKEIWRREKVAIGEMGKILWHKVVKSLEFGLVAYYEIRKILNCAT